MGKTNARCGGALYHGLGAEALPLLVALGREAPLLGAADAVSGGVHVVHEVGTITEGLEGHKFLRRVCKLQ